LDPERAGSAVSATPPEAEADNSQTLTTGGAVPPGERAMPGIPRATDSRRKIRLALVFGGQSAEHEVSLSSARSVVGVVDPARYEVIPIGISVGGQWLLGPAAGDLLALAPSSTKPAEQAEHGEQGERTDWDGGNTVTLEDGTATARQVALALSPTAQDTRRNGTGDSDPPIDVVFPLLHGPRGEDGTVQGLFELAGVPYVGAGIAASAVGMDKVLMKNLFQQAGLPVVPFVAIPRTLWQADPATVAAQIEATVGYPCFAKPANMGSSIGISRVEGPRELAAALDLAAGYDRRLLVEQAISRPRELECGVLGNDVPEVSVVGEVRVTDDASFYDYDAKYQPGGSGLVIPADVDPAIAGRIRDLARRAFLAIDGAGMARVDFFLSGNGQLYLNEINTIPGFTPTSMFPLLWAASGVPYPALIDLLVDLALERHASG